MDVNVVLWGISCGEGVHKFSDLSLDLKP